MHGTRLLTAASLFLLVACHTAAPEGRTLFADEPPTWFEDGYSRLSISPSGERAIYRGRRRLLLIDVASGKVLQNPPWQSFAKTLDALFMPTGTLACLVEEDGQRSWQIQAGEGFEQSRLPADAMPSWSADGSKLAFYRGRGSEDLHIQMAGRELTRNFDRKVVALAWAPDGNNMYVLLRDEQGVSAVLEVDPMRDGARKIAAGLDGPAFANSLAMHPDGGSLYLALVGESPPLAESRHAPEADRDLDLYRLDLSTEKLSLVASNPGDDFAPRIAGRRLYWTNNRVEESLVLIPSAGGGSKELGLAGQLPGWSADGRHLVYTFGGWRVADWGLNLDVAMHEIDAAGDKQGEAEILIEGFHEDFTPAWSPDGRWMVYHSHRSAAAVPGYDSPGSTDDLFLRAGGEIVGEEVRLTDFGWEVGLADWSPAGDELVFSSWERGGTPGINRAWVLKIDAEKGLPLYAERLAVPDDLSNPMWLSWAPASSEIAIESDQGGGKRSLWVVRRDGLGARLIHEYQASTYGGLTWSRDGARIIFSGLADGRMQLHAISKDGGNATRLSEDEANLLHPQISPDGNWIACTRLQWHKEIRELDL